MLGSATNNNTKLWFLVGPLDSAEPTRCQPIFTSPFIVGRREGLSLTLADKTVSTCHAEICEAAGVITVRDLGSTNGTYVNGQRASGAVVLQEDDLVQFASVAFRVRQQVAHTSQHTVQENVCDRALALVQFDKLMAERAVTPFYQPIIDLANGRTLGYEVLGRSRLFGLESPKEMFDAAAHLNLEVELSVMLRWEGVSQGDALNEGSHLYVNTHPRELNGRGIFESLRSLRQSFPEQILTLEIHETAVTHPRRMKELRRCLTELQIGLSYDDFGAGQSRLNELIESPPDVLKFDMSLIRGIDTAPAHRQQVLSTLVAMAAGLGIQPLAEGVETAGEAESCRQLGFQLGQGYYFGRPAPPRRNLSAAATTKIKTG